ncbi:hypothetical protein K1719_037147 [Acacia pycnantha]|nr:hypothetical protein K1719_037147 [Acacia pycnantha]
MGSVQTPLIGSRSSPSLETSCGFLLQELQMIWDEVGEDEFEREKVLLELEQECVDAYRRKVDRANIARARLHQQVAESEAEFTHLLLSLGEPSLPGVRPEKRAGTLREQLDSITPALKEMRLRKEERVGKFRNVQSQIQKLSAEIAGNSDITVTTPSSNIVVNENDLSLKKLDEFNNEFQRLHNEKNERLQQVEKYIDIIHSLSTILGKDYSAIITEVDPSLNDLCGVTKNISDTILTKLNHTVESLVQEKHKRLDQLHHLGKELTKLWNLMDTPREYQKPFTHVINLLSFSPAEVSDPGSLTIEIIQQAEAEVRRLDQLKSSKMKELFQKKQEELELICSKTHMEIPSKSDINNILGLINSGEIDHSDLLMSMDEQIARAKEEACSRKPIMEKVEKWILARDEERWLEEYSMDEKRYTVCRGNHKNLRRAERARILVKKIPALVDMLTDMTRSWEEERNKVFLYDQVPLMAMLEEYNAVKQEREEEKRIRQREKKKVIPSARVGGQDNNNSFGMRPGTSSSRRSSMNSINVGKPITNMSFIKDVGRNKVHNSKVCVPGMLLVLQEKEV